jgi:beta-glucosidase
MELLDLALRRILTQKFALGLFEQPYVDSGSVAFDTPEQRQLARQIAQKSIVLLRNEGDLLPLDKNLTSIAVIGPNADCVRTPRAVLSRVKIPQGLPRRLRRPAKRRLPFWS